MGSTYALGIAETVANEQISLDHALRMHLTANHYPPLPVALIPLAKEAIERARDEEWDENIALPLDFTYQLRENLKVWEVVETLHLYAFL